MAGYNGYSMSNNAVAAYEKGLKPLGKFNKEDMAKLPINLSDIKLLAKLCIWLPCEWHHSSKFYNKTNFYNIKELEIAFNNRNQKNLEVTFSDIKKQLKKELKRAINNRDFAIMNSKKTFWEERPLMLSEILKEIKSADKLIKSINNLLRKL